MLELLHACNKSQPIICLQRRYALQMTTKTLYYMSGNKIGPILLLPLPAQQRTPHKSGAGETWNPVTGCTQISPGCENCYAPHPAFGRLPRERIEQIHTAHAAHHLRFLTLCD